MAFVFEKGSCLHWDPEHPVYLLTSNQVIKMFYWCQPVSKWSSLVDTPQKWKGNFLGWRLSTPYVYTLCFIYYNFREVDNNSYVLIKNHFKSHIVHINIYSHYLLPINNLLQFSKVGYIAVSKVRHNIWPLKCTSCQYLPCPCTWRSRVGIWKGPTVFSCGKQSMHAVSYEALGTRDAERGWCQASLLEPSNGSCLFLRSCWLAFAMMPCKDYWSQFDSIHWLLIHPFLLECLYMQPHYC